MNLQSLRAQYHERIAEDIIRIRTSGDRTYPNFADGGSRSSRTIAAGIVRQIGRSGRTETVHGQTAGRRFEQITCDYLSDAFARLQHLRPAAWEYLTTNTVISNFDQYRHLAHIDNLVQDDETLASALGRDYLITPDIVVGRHPVDEASINADAFLLDPENHDVAGKTPLRASNGEADTLLLHASISCKWTIRSGRSQNARTEALNLIRNRKGRTPHIVAVTAEPLPTRIASIALGTGDLDGVYHFALSELVQSVADADNPDQREMFDMLIHGRRLRDISDLPFDLIT